MAIIIIISYTGLNVDSKRVELSGVTGTETNVTGLTPGVNYTFSVTAENAVSSQDPNISDRTATVTAMTKEGGITCIFGNSLK